jgi:hypothetical protein
MTMADYGGEAVGGLSDAPTRWGAIAMPSDPQTPSGSSDRVMPPIDEDVVGTRAGSARISGGSAGRGDVAGIAELDQIRRVLRDVPLAKSLRHDTKTTIQRIREELKERNLAGSAADLEHLTTILIDSGTLAAEGRTLVGPIGRIAKTLGQPGDRVLQQLQRVESRVRPP